MGSIRQFRPGRSPFDDIMHVEDDGTEWWSAREMVVPLGYSRWENVDSVIRRAKAACRNSGHDPSNHFREVTKMVDIGSGTVRSIADVQMTRFGCYLLAMNGDPNKPEIAAAQRYFTLMTRAAEKAIAVPAAIVQAPRPWSERFRQTVEPHIRFMYMNHPDGFTVASTLVGQILCMEDELIRHMFELKSSDRPDVSIGLCWANDRRNRGLPDVQKFAPLRLPDQAMDVWLSVYDNIERGAFETWFGRVYLPEKLPNYYDRKPEFRREGELPPASAAEHTCQRLTGRPADLKPHLRRQLVAVGGFFPVGAKLPSLGFSQLGLFDGLS
jgi:hypothetical protein